MRGICSDARPLTPMLNMDFSRRVPDEAFLSGRKRRRMAGLARYASVGPLPLAACDQKRAA
jgi:hypothetical protein